MIKNDEHQLESDIKALMTGEFGWGKEGLIADLEQYKKSLIFECVTGKREVA